MVGVTPQTDKLLDNISVLRTAVLITASLLVGCMLGEEGNQDELSHKAVDAASKLGAFTNVRVVINDLSEFPCEIPVPQKRVDSLITGPFAKARLDRDPARYMVVAVIRGQRGPSTSPTPVKVFVFSGWQRAKIDDSYYMVDLRRLRNTVSSALRSALRDVSPTSRTQG